MQLEHLVSAVRHQLSEEDQRLLRAVYAPPPEDEYDELFDRVLEQLKERLYPTLRGRRSH